MFKYQRLKTLEVNVGGIGIGGSNPIRVQTMTTTDTLDTQATVQQTIRCVAAGAELVRITAPSKKEAENLLNIKNELKKQGVFVPLVADIHFTPNAAEIAARIVEKVRINPGNYIDKKKFEILEYSDVEYQNEIAKIRDRFLPLLRICKSYGTSMRIGTNHGSLSDRIMSRYGDGPMGMVESAMEFLRIAVDENYKQIILSMKSSNPIVMVHAYRLLVEKMYEEFQFCFPLHLGVTEAGDGEDGRIKSAVGIGTLLEEGIGDTIRVSLTEDPEFEIPVCKNIVERYTQRATDYVSDIQQRNTPQHQYIKNHSHAVLNVGGDNVPIVLSDFRQVSIHPNTLSFVGYNYDAHTDKWLIKDDATDFLWVNTMPPTNHLPQSLKLLLPYAQWNEHLSVNVFPVFEDTNYDLNCSIPHFVHWQIDDRHTWERNFSLFNKPNLILLISSTNLFSYHCFKAWFATKRKSNNFVPTVIVSYAYAKGNIIDQQLIHYASEVGSLLLDGFGDGICLSSSLDIDNSQIVGRTYMPLKSMQQFLNNTAFSILQATRTRISKTEYISCPSCGRTLFDLQETTTKIRNATHHLKGVKIAIMGCIVNGPGEMADADFGYVGSGPNKIHLYKGKEIVEKNIPATEAVEALIRLIKDNGRWND